MRAGTDDELQAEIVVIGSGPGGSVTACLLAEAGRDVMLLEEGPGIGQSSCEEFSSLEMVQKYRNGGVTVTMGASRIVYVEGRCAGGGSEINSGLCTRVPAEILEEWKQTNGVKALSLADIEPRYDRNDAELPTAVAAEPAPASRILKAGADAMGWKSWEVPRWVRFGDRDAAGAPSFRNSMTESFLPRGHAAGLRVHTGARAVAIRRHGDHWAISTRSVDGADAGEIAKVRARFVFVACGATQTPALLLRSRIGRNVGDSLSLHPMLKVVARFADDMTTVDPGMPARQINEFSPRLGFGCSISKPAYLATLLMNRPEHLGEIDTHANRLAAFYVGSRGGSGTIRLIPGFADPLVRFGLSRPELTEITDGFLKLCQVLFAAGAESIFTGITGLEVLRSEEDLSEVPEMIRADDLNLTTVHLMGSCPMGENESRSVTDSFGKVHGHDGLYIADSSLFCGSIGVNPQATIMALARRNAEHFLEIA